MFLSCKLIPWIPLISTLGFLILLRHLISLIRWLSNTVFRLPRDLRSRYGSWAIVTGCTDGIGRAFAFNLTQRGLNLILISRSRDKLERLSGELLAINDRILVRDISLDFSEDVSGGVREIEEMARNLDVGVLINNVGVTYLAARFFHEVDEDVLKKIGRVNVEGTARVTRVVLPGMVEGEALSSTWVPEHQLLFFHSHSSQFMLPPKHLLTNYRDLYTSNTSTTVSISSVR